MRKNLKWKKLIGLVMSCLMICSIVPLNSFALQNDYRYDEFLKYDAENSQIVLLNGSDENNYKKLTIPAYIGNDKVEKISSIIFNDLPVEEIEFMDGIKEISAYAISHCNTLKKVKIPSTCEIIGGPSYMPAIEYCKNLETIEMCGEYISLPLFVADCPNLKDVIFYGDVRNITTEFKYNFYNCQPRDKTVNPRVFTEKINVTLQCKSNSNIEKFAIENDFKFVSINDMYVPSTWAIAEVESAINRGYVPNDIQKDYNEPIKRGEFARMAVEFLRCELGFSYEEFSEKVKSVFDTVDFSDSADEHVLLAAQCGIVYGYEDNIFAPDKLISREEAAAMLARVYNLYGNIYSYSNIDFQDNEQISDWAVSDVKFCVSKGIMKGVSDSHFDPKGEYTREQAIVTFWRLDSDTDWENHNKMAKIRRKMTKELAESELFSNNTTMLVEKYETPYGTVCYTLTGGMMYALGYDLLLIDDNGEIYGLTAPVPSDKVYRTIPEIKNITFTPEGTYLSFEVSFDIELKSEDGNEIHKAGTYFFETNLAQKKTELVKFVPKG